jgi:hypothetical protein
MPKVPKVYEIGVFPMSNLIGVMLYSLHVAIKCDCQPALARTSVPKGYSPFFVLITLCNKNENYIDKLKYAQLIKAYSASCSPCITAPISCGNILK